MIEFQTKITSFQGDDDGSSSDKISQEDLVFVNKLLGKKSVFRDNIEFGTTFLRRIRKKQKKSGFYAPVPALVLGNEYCVTSVLIT